MTLFNNEGRNTLGETEAILDLNDIQSPALSVDGSETDYLFPLGFPLQSEPCFVTKTQAFTNERTYWIQPGKTREETLRIQHRVRELRICRDDFRLHSGVNLSNLHCFVHKAMNTLSFIAVTGSRETLTQLIELLQKDRSYRQNKFNKVGVDPGRIIPFDHPALQNAEYELVALYPELLLPNGSFLTIFDRNTDTFKTYIPSSDRRLREMPGDLACPPPPSFSAPARADDQRLNPFLVILNAEVRFRRYLRQVALNAPTTHLPDDILELMKLTTNLVDLLYWKPEIDESTKGGRIAKARYEREGRIDRSHEASVGEDLSGGANLETRVALGTTPHSDSD